MYWNTIQIRLTRFDYIDAAKKVPFSSRQIAERKAKYAAKKIDECAISTIQEEADEAFGSGASETKTKYINQRKNQCKVSEIFKGNAKLQKLKRACDSSLSEECYDVPLNEYASYMSTPLMNNLLPLVGGMFPGAGPQQAMALYTGGWTLCISTVFSIIALALGCGHLYYYSEVKASKNARKGAMFAFTAAPSLCLFCFLAIAAVALILSQGGGGSQYTAFVASKSSAFPREGFWCILFNMIAMGMQLCYSRHWRMKRAERVRKQQKDEEEEEEFMQLMGIDRSKLDEESEEETSDEESSDEEEPEDEERPRAQKPAIVQSAPPMNTFPGSVVTYPVGQSYTTQTYTIPAQQYTQPQVTTQRIVIDPNQPGTQRIML